MGKKERKAWVQLLFGSALKAASIDVPVKSQRILDQVLIFF